MENEIVANVHGVGEKQIKMRSVGMVGRIPKHSVETLVAFQATKNKIYCEDADILELVPQTGCTSESPGNCRNYSMLISDSWRFKFL